MFISVAEIRTIFDKSTPEDLHDDWNGARASVALILVNHMDDLNICFIKRAKRDGDPWSGQVALPGGRATDDEDAFTVAERETFEEVGLILSRTSCVGRLEPIDVSSNLNRQRLLLSPVLYLLEEDAIGQAKVASPSEVDSVFWVPMNHLFDPNSHTTIRYPNASKSAAYPGIGFERYVIWGLTLRVLRNFAEVIGRNLPH